MKSAEDWFENLPNESGGKEIRNYRFDRVVNERDILEIQLDALKEVQKMAHNYQSNFPHLSQDELLNEAHYHIVNSIDDMIIRLEAMAPLFSV